MLKRTLSSILILFIGGFIAGHEESRIFELEGYGHDIVAPSCPLIINEINRILNTQ